MINLIKKFTNYLKLFSIFFIISILFVQLVDVNTLQAEEYRLVKGTLIIDSGKNPKGIEVLLSRAILGEGVIDKFTAVAKSKKNVIRGIHFQTKKPQNQLLYLVEG